jgi:hypothetical protein
MEVAPGRARLARAAAPLAGLIVLAVALAAIDTLPVGVFIDDAMYVILAKALATGQGYHWLNLPGAPAATHFPPAYPLFLAAIWRVFPNFPGNVLAFKAANAVLLAIVGVAMVVFARRRFGFSPLAAVVLSVASCAAIPVLVLSALVLSEPLFLALLIPLLLFAERVVDGERRTRDLVLLGLLAGVATLVRTHGIALTGGLALALVLRPPSEAGMSGERFAALRSRMMDGLVVVVCAALVMLPWQLWVRANHGLVPEAMRGMYESYASWLAGGVKHDGVGILARTSVRTSTEIAGMFATLATPFALGWARLITIVTVSVLLIAGLKKSWRVAPVTALFFVAYVTIVVLWPFGPSRFIWGIWPLVILICALGAVEAKSWAPRIRVASAARMLLLACTLFVSVGYIRYNARGYRGRWWSSLSRTQAHVIRPVVLWARSRTRPDEVIASTVEPAVYLYSGRLAVPVTAFNVRDYFRPPTVGEAETALRQIIAGYHVDAIAIGAGDTLRAAVRSMVSRDELVVRDSFLNGLVFTPAASLRVSSQHPDHQ